MSRTRNAVRRSLAGLALAGVSLSVMSGAPATVSAASAETPLAGVGAFHAATAPASSLAPRTASLLSSFSFASVLDGKPVRWNPCAPIRWTSNTTAGPVGGLAVLKAAVAKVAAQTGTTWTYVGATTTVPTGAYLPTRSATSYPPILVGWTDATRSDLLRAQPAGVLGMTRTAWFGVQKPDGSKVAATRAAVVALDRTDRLPLTGAVSWSAVALHELSHAVGLGHTADRSQLMASVLPRSTGDLQAGDRTGLTRLGRTAGCVVV